jgi:hypothetical protein
MGDEREKLDAGEIAAVLFPALVNQGPHAYGWMSYNEQDDEIEHRKFPGRCDTETAWENILVNVDPKAKWLVGHTRWATHGDPKDNRNNHPVEHGQIIGVHNGVLSNHKDILAVTGRDDEETEVDSEAIFAAVNKWGGSKGLRRILGSMVTVYADYRKPHLLYIGRSHGRQLTLGFTTKGNMIFASDESALHKLEPEIQFRKFSVINENRLLIVRNGKVIQRFTFRQPTHSRPKYVAPPASIKIPAGSMSDAFAAGLAQERASKRGEILFQNRERANRAMVRAVVSPQEVEKDRKKREREQAQSDRPSVGRLYYHDGTYMSRTEYLRAIGSVEVDDD